MNDGNGGANYALNTSAAAGLINKAPITLSAVGDSRVYDGTSTSAAAPVVASGLAAGDSVSSLAQAFDSRNAGTRTLTVVSYALNDGNGGNNYTVTTTSAAGSIVRAPLILGAVSDGKVYDGGTVSRARPTVVSGLVAGDSVSSLSQAFDSKDAGARTLVVGSYVVTK